VLEGSSETLGAAQSPGGNMAESQEAAVAAKAPAEAPTLAATDAETQLSQLAQAESPSTPGGSSAVPELALACVEGMSWKELQETADPTSYCTSCGQVCTETVLVSEKIRMKGHQRLRCTSCQRITTMLYKRVDMQQLGFKDLDPEQARHFCFFFKSKICSETCSVYLAGSQLLQRSSFGQRCQWASGLGKNQGPSAGYYLHLRGAATDDHLEG